MREPARPSVPQAGRGPLRGDCAPVVSCVVSPRQRARSAHDSSSRRGRSALPLPAPRTPLLRRTPGTGDERSGRCSSCAGVYAHFFPTPRCPWQRGRTAPPARTPMMIEVNASSVKHCLSAPVLGTSLETRWLRGTTRSTRDHMVMGVNCDVRAHCRSAIPAR